MFGRAGKIRRAIETSVKAALAGDGDGAFAPIEKLREGERVEAYVDLCHQLIYHEDLVAAGAAIDKALALAPEELYVLDAKAELAVEDGRAPDALAIYRRMYEISPDDPAVVDGLASLLLGADEAAEAVELLERHATPNWPELQLRLGEALYATNRAQEALELLEAVHDHYTAALRQASFVDNFEELKNRLQQATMLRDDVFADVHGREATVEKHARGGGLDGRAGVNYTLLGQSLAVESDYEPAELELASVSDTYARAAALLDARGNDPLGLTLRGMAELREGALDTAMSSFEAATAADGRFFPAFFGLGAAMDCGSRNWFRQVESLPAPGSAAGLEQVVPDWPALTRLERQVVWASAEPFAAALPALADAGTQMRILPIDVRATDVPALAEAAGKRFSDDHRSMDAIGGLATHGTAIAKIERLLDVVGDNAWTFAHELAHLVFFAIDESTRDEIHLLYMRALEAGYAVSEYQTNNPDELFAVAYTDYVRQRHDLATHDRHDDAGINAALFEIFDAI